MARKESRYPEDWLKVATKDARRVRQMLSLHDVEAAGFYLQQAVEKFLKAFLISKGWKLERIHDLESLLNDAIAFRPDLEAFRELCQKISGFYFVERYPFIEESGLTEEDVHDSLQGIEGLIEILKKEMSQ